MLHFKPLQKDRNEYISFDAHKRTKRGAMKKEKNFFFDCGKIIAVVCYFLHLILRFLIPYISFYSFFSAARQINNSGSVCGSNIKKDMSKIIMNNVKKRSRFRVTLRSNTVEYLYIMYRAYISLLVPF